jgi:hypothetical protein
VPEYAIVMEGDISLRREEHEDPEDWFQYLKHGYKIKDMPEEFRNYFHRSDHYSMRKCFGKEHGFQFLTRKGFEANEDILRSAWQQATAHFNPEYGRDWGFVKRYAEFFFQQVDIATERYRQKQLEKMQ